MPLPEWCCSPQGRGWTFGDYVFAQMTTEEAADWSPRVIRLADQNRQVLKKDELLVGDNTYSG